MAANPRKSQVSIARKSGRPLEFKPDVKEWKKACKITATNKQIIQYFCIGSETFYAFLDKERYKEEKEKNYVSEFLVSLKEERNKTREFIANKFLTNINDGDTASTIFGMKVFNGMIEAKDLQAHNLRKKEFALRNKQFLTELANKFELSYDELNKFASKYFKDAKLDDI